MRLIDADALVEMIDEEQCNRCLRHDEWGDDACLDCKVQEIYQYLVLAKGVNNHTPQN